MRRIRPNIDPLFGNSKDIMLTDQCSSIGNADKKDPYLSPLFGNFEGFPPMLMQRRRLDEVLLR